MLRDFAAEAAALPHFDFDLVMHRFMLRRLHPWLDGVSALELGCHHGAMTERLAAIYPDLTAVDASLPSIEIARGRVPLVKFIYGEFETVELERRYDVIFLVHVLEHLDDPVLVLKRCRDWLLPGGRVIVVVPNAGAASRRIAVHMGLIPAATAVTPAEAAHGHNRTYDEALLEAHMVISGLTIADLGGIMFKPLANYQADSAMKHGIISDGYLEGCFKLGDQYPELCASIFVVCR